MLLQDAVRQILATGVTQSELARRVGVTPASISLLLSDPYKKPSYRLVARVEREYKRAFGRRPQWSEAMVA